LVFAMFGVAGSASAQFRQPRSLDYLFVATASDVRATWVNPAGLSAVTDASVMGEVMVGRTSADDFRLQQWTIGFNSRGFSVSYVRNRFETLESTSAVRFGFGVAFSGGGFGLAVSNYRAPGDNSRDLDLGIQYSLGPLVTVAGVVRHIGSPVVGDVELPLEYAGGGSFSLAEGAIELSGEGIATERLGPSESGYDVRYRAGARLALSVGRQLDVFAVADLGSNFGFDRLHIGLVVGGSSRLGGLGTGLSPNGSTRIDRWSLTGVSHAPLDR